jgi:hypothetical protein
MTEPKPYQITKEMIKIAIDQPAIYSNKFYFTSMPGAVRIAFCEQLFKEDDPLYQEKARTTIILPNEEFLKLSQEMFRLVQQLQSEQTPKANTDK